MRAAVVAIVGLAPALAHAQPKHADTSGNFDSSARTVLLEIDDCQPSSLPTDERLRVSFEHYQRGETLYSQGDYPAAVTEFVDAYCLRPDLYLILKDIGQAYERDLDYEKSIEYLKRYVAQVPLDAKKTEACAPEPQVDKDNVIARIGVLERLRARVLVETEPKDADIVIANAAGVKNVGHAGESLDVVRGHYTLTVSKAGYQTKTSTLDTKIGLPMTVFVHLEPVKGKLSLLATPGDARLYLDKNFVGTGRFEDRHINAGKYVVTAEANGYEPATQAIVVLPEQESRISIEMDAKPQSGRWQAILAATVGGAVAAGSLTNIAGQLGYQGITGGAIVGAAIGFVGSYFVMPTDISIGTSSLSITSAIAGYLVGSTGAALFTDSANVIAPLGGAAAVTFAAAGYYVGEKTHIKSGDAAVINTGMFWGTAFGSLFVASFDATRRVGAGLTLSGLGMGTLGGILSAHYFHASRSHAALIDLGGVLGLVGGLAAEALAYPTKGGNATQAAQEHLANFAIGGIAIGLVTAGILTRNFDSPPLPIAPTIGTAATAGGSSTPTLGIGGTF